MTTVAKGTMTAKEKAIKIADLLGSNDMHRPPEEWVQSIIEDKKISSLGEACSVLNDAVSPSSQEQKDAMHNIISFCKGIHDFKKAHSYVSFQGDWSLEHERIFLHAWLNECWYDAVRIVWSEVVGLYDYNCSAGAQRMIIQKAIELFKEDEE